MVREYTYRWWKGYETLLLYAVGIFSRRVQVRDESRLSLLQVQSTDIHVNSQLMKPVPDERTFSLNQDLLFTVTTKLNAEL